MCGKGVGLGLFPSDSLESQKYDFDEIVHIKPYMVSEDPIKVLSSRKEYLKKPKKFKIGRFQVIFGLILACFSDPSHTIPMPLCTQEPLWV